MLCGEVIRSTTAERDLGVLVEDSINVDQQTAKVIKSANPNLGMIYRTYKDKSVENVVRLYKSLVRPLLEYAIQAWRPYLQRHVDSLEKVQKRLRMIHGFSSMSYEEQLDVAGLISLEMRRLRADLIEVFIIVKGI